MSAPRIPEIRRGMPYGSLPHDALTRKFATTDDELGDRTYDDYVRGEIVDRAPDPAFLESDQTRRDPGLSRSMLNLRYNGVRGSAADPKRADFFYGFLGNDPRGVVNEPRLDKARSHMSARAGGLVTRMGDNDDGHTAERPWTNQAISYAMQAVHTRQKDNLRVFSTSKESRSRRANDTMTGEATVRRLRAERLRVGDEALGARLAGGDHAPADEKDSGGVRGADAGQFAGAGAAPWHHAVGDADLGVAQYGQNRGGGRATVGAGAQGGGRLAAAAHDQDWGKSSLARAANRRTLAATMAAAARHRRADRARITDQDFGSGHEMYSVAGAGLMPGTDVAAAARHGGEDQTRRPAGEIQDDAGGEMAGAGLIPGADIAAAHRYGGEDQTRRPNGEIQDDVGGGAAGAGLVPGADVAAAYRHAVEDTTRRPAGEVQDDDDGGIPGAGLMAAHRPERAAREAIASVTQNEYLTNAGAIVAGLREGSAAARRRIASAVVADSAPGPAGADMEGHGPRRGEVRGAATGRAARAGEVLIVPAGAAGLAVHSYRGGVPTGPDARAANARAADDAALWRSSHEALPIGRSKTAGEWRSATQGGGMIGDAAEKVFGRDGVVEGQGVGSAPVKPKTLRAGARDWSGDEVGDAMARD
jgi:hypothetical protein